MEKTNLQPSTKKSRLRVLLDAALYVYDSKGLIPLINQIVCFIKGERQNINLFVNIASVSPPVSNERVNIESVDKYLLWMQKNEPDLFSLNLQKQTEKKFNYRPLFSILTPVYNTEKELLEKMIKSVINQTYSNWELCLVDGGSTQPHISVTLENLLHRDSRIKVNLLNENRGISANSNEALKMANGEFIALLDHDDELSPNALYENVALLNKYPDADMIYSDEDKLNQQGSRFDPYFKPDWSPDFFYSSMYTCHLGVYRTSIIKKMGGFRCEFDGAQDWDLVLRLIEETDKIYHIPKVLYHWRQTENSTALSLSGKDYAKAAQIKAVQEHFNRSKIEVEVTPGLEENLLRVRRLFAEKPKVSIIIPTRDMAKVLRICIESVQDLTSYQNYEIIIIDNNSIEIETLNYFREISKEPKIRIISYPAQFNFAAINNFAVGCADGDLLLFLNNDTEVISPEWLEAMVEHAVRPEVGLVGARLLYSNDTIQHAGVIIGIGGVAGHSHKYYSRNHPGYFSRAKAIQNVSAVTAACMMVRKEIFNSLGGFNAKNLAVAFNDIDLCLRIRQRGMLIIYTPYAELYHHESISRGNDYEPEKALRFQYEAEYMLDHWKEELRYDPYYNPNLTLEREDFSY